MNRMPRHAGVGLTEMLVAVVIVALVVLMILAALPRGRETARLVGCQRHLGQIGVALSLFHEHTGHWPAVAEPTAAGPGPLRLLLEELGTADFTHLKPSEKPPPRAPGTGVAEGPIAGLVCPSDPVALSLGFPAPVSYRANAGDAPEGRDGPFAPGRTTTRAEVESADGAGYTAAFAERLLGDGQPLASERNYARVPGPLVEPPCPAAPAPAWRGDAGFSWFLADWRSTLYNHALTPNAHPSCLADDDGSALIGASSPHPNRIHVLMLDGAVKPVTPRVDPKIWRAMGNMHDLGQ
jgi:prepilin-type processing-associated H-X9-DG protein